jgi:hypothetical protein
MKTIEDEIIERASSEMARAIDKELLDDLMIDVLTSEGWTVTTMNPAYEPPLSRLSNGEWYSETAEWIHLNAKGDYKLLKGQWVFKDPKDAMWFTLRWSS